jgi:hypothetical protein
MYLRCTKCGHLNSVPPNAGARQFFCYYCGAPLPKAPQPSSDVAEAVGLIGGAALGAAIAGPVGAVIGAVIGVVIGRESKGVG